MKNLALLQINPSHSLIILCILCDYPPPWVWLDLLSTFVLTPPLLLYQRKTLICYRGCRVVGRSAPDAAYGAGPFQDASAGVLLLSWLGPSPGRALECSCRFPVACYCFSWVPASTGCTVNCAICWINVYQSPRAKALARRRAAARRLVPRRASRRPARPTAVRRCCPRGRVRHAARCRAGCCGAARARCPAVWPGASMIPGSATWCMIN